MSLLRRRLPHPSALFNRRLLVVLTFQILLICILIGRLFYLQIIQKEQYQMLAEENRIHVRWITPARGRILDRKGTVLAENKKNYSLLLVPEQAGNVDTVLEKLRVFLGLSDDEIAQAQRQRRQGPAYFPFMVKESLSWDEVARFEVNSFEFPGVSVEENETRLYPFGSGTAHLLGYVAAPAQEDMDADASYKIPSIRIGKNGLEKMYEAELRGAPGALQIEVNAQGRRVRDLLFTPSEAGQDLTLTLDMDLQNYIVERLQEFPSACAVVLDVQTGAVLALVSLPSYDPHLFLKGIDTATWKALLENPHGPLTNKVIAGLYPPASTFKPLVMLVALSQKTLEAHNKFYCPGHMDLGSHRFHCHRWRQGGHQHVSMIEAMAQSCDVYFYEVGLRIGGEAITSIAKYFGFGAKTGIDLPGEKAGLVPDAAWKKTHRKEPWYKGDTLNLTIGQGAFQATPLQMALMTAELVNGGHRVRPHMRADPMEETRGESLNLDQAALAQVLQGMEDAVNHPRGTAYAPAPEGYRMGGKTGTAQVVRITKAERQDKSIPYKRTWERQDHALFVGYAPVGAPKYAIAVIIEHGIGGGKVAAPVGRDILLYLQQHDKPRAEAA